MAHSCHNIAEILWAAREDARGDRPAVWCEDARLSYSELGALASRAGALFLELGVTPQARVVLMLHDGPEFIASFFGAAAIGALPVPLNTFLAPGEYEHLINHSGATVAVVSAALLPMITAIRARCPQLNHVLAVGGEAPAFAASWGDRIRAVSPNCPVVPVAPDDPAFWLYSSGSSGTPNAVVHAHRSLAVTCERYGRQTLGIRPDDVCFSAAKLFHAYGLGNGMSFPLSTGAQTVLWPGPPMPETLFELIERHRPTVFFATPALFNGMLAVAASGRPRSMESVRMCVSAGEALPAATFERWKKRFDLEILDGIGSTEMLHIFIANHPGRARAGSTGTVVAGYRAKVVDESGRPVPADTVGDLWVQGESAALRYEGDPAFTEQTFRGDWVVTGDKYVQDAQGFFWFQGRRNDMMKVNGLWVSPAELEHVLAQHDAVLESAVVGIRDADGLMQIKAFVVLRDPATGSDELVKQLQAFVRRQLPQRYPKLFEFVSALPKTATGKVKRFQLRRMETLA